MSNAVLVLGKTGSGKSTSIENLNPDETFIINIVGKELPFRGGNKKYNTENKNYYSTNKYDAVLKVLKNVNEKALNIKTVIIDDFQYLMSYEFMTSTTGGYEKFNEIQQHAFAVINAAKTMREDVTIIFLSHTEETIDTFGAKSYKIKTIGKMLDDKIVIEGLFTIVLMAEQREEGSDILYGFKTKGGLRDTVKSPKGMFEDEFINNDLKLVLDKISEFNEG